MCAEAAFHSPKWQLQWAANTKSILALQRLRQKNLFPHDDVPLTEQRLRFQKTIAKSWFFFEFANETSLFYQRRNNPAVAVPDSFPPSAWKAKWHLVDRDSLDIFHRIDRLYAQFSPDPIEIRIGKQVIAEGVGRLFAAVSQVPRFPFVVVDQEYPMTEDAVTFLWNGPLVLEARFLPKVASQKDQNFHFRAKGSKGGYDIAFTAGRSDDKPYAALESAGNVGASLLRGEIVGYDRRGGGFLQGLIGYDHVFSSTWSGDIELFHNGFGKQRPYPVGPSLHRSSPYQGLWYAGTTLKWEMTARLKGVLNTIVNLLDVSALLHLYFSFSLGGNTELLLGQFLGVGGADTEFAGKQPIDPLGTLQIGLPDLSYFVFKWYF